MRGGEDAGQQDLDRDDNLLGDIGDADDAELEGADDKGPNDDKDEKAPPEIKAPLGDGSSVTGDMPELLSREPASVKRKVATNRPPHIPVDEWRSAGGAKRLKLFNEYMAALGCEPVTALSRATAAVRADPEPDAEVGGLSHTRQLDYRGEARRRESEGRRVSQGV